MVGLSLLKSEYWEKYLHISTENKHFLKEKLLECEQIADLKLHDFAAVSREVELLIKTAPWRKSDDKDVIVIIKHLITCYIISSTDVKLLRLFLKLLTLIRKEKSDLINCELSAVLWPLLQTTDTSSVTDLLAVSNLMDVDRNIQTLLSSDVSRLMKTVSEILKESHKNPDCLHLAVKISLQAFVVTPYYPDHVSHVLSDSNHNQSKDLFHVLQTLVNVLFIKDVNVDILSLAATSLIMTVKTIISPKNVTDIYKILVAAIDSERVKKIKIGHVEVLIPDIKESRTSVKLMLLKSIVTCSTENILLFHNPSNRGDNNNIYFVDLFEEISKLCYQNEEMYLKSQLFLLWCKQLIKLWPEITINLKTNNEMTDSEQVMSSELSEIEESVTRRTIEFIWLNLESPVEDVPQHTMEILQSLLEVGWSEGRKKSVLDEMLTRSLKTQWNVRSRYKPLQLILPHLKPDQMYNLCEELKEDLFQCMSINYLVPHSSDVYKAFLQNIRPSSEDEKLNWWIEVWRDLLIRGVLNVDSLTRSKVNTYWVPLTLKLLPSSGAYLQRYLSTLINNENSETGREKLLYAWCVVVKSIRTFTGIDLHTLDYDILRDVLYCEDVDVRMEGLGLICNSNKKSEALSDIEMEFLKEFLPLNLRVDSAPFRQLLGTNLQRLLIRVRDSCLSFLKKKCSYDHLEKGMEFVDWLHCVLISNLLPGVSFQRRKSCLDNLHIMYQVFLSTSHSRTKKKNQSSVSTENLLKSAASKGMWDFFKHENFVCLVHCLLDGADDIRELSYNLIQNWYSWPKKQGIPLAVPDIEMLSSHLLAESLHMCNKPKASDSHSGALLSRLVFNKFSSIGMDFQIKKNVKLDLIEVVSSEGSLESSPVNFIKLLSSEIKECMKTAVSNPVYASQHHPIHGLIQAISFCVTDLMSGDCISSQSLDAVLVQLVSDCVGIIDLMLSVMSGGKTSETCLSFAELGSAIETMVTDEQCDNTVLSPEFQCLLSWCWVNLKTCCTCLGDVLSVIVTSSTMDVVMLASQIRDVYLKVLTNCRHRGAIEGCRNGLMKFCLTLMNSPYDKLRMIPNSLLAKVFTCLESSDKMASVTRRSAGLPIIVHVVTAAAKRNKLNGLIDDTLDKLFKLASEPIPKDWDQRQDLPAVHALNILKAVFGDCSLSASLMPLHSQLMILVIESFESPCWAIRNAASQLFSTLIVRMFGPKGSGSCLTLKEFSGHYPELPPFLLKKLDESVETLDDRLHPTLYLVLTILSSLSPSPIDYELQDDFRKRVQKLLGNPIYGLRELSALSLVALLSLDKTEVWLLDFVHRIAVLGGNVTNHNFVHGNLILIEKLLQDRNISKTFSFELLNNILQCSWLVSASKCCLLGLKFCCIVGHLVAKYGCSSEHMKILETQMLSTISEQRQPSLLVGKSFLLSSLVDLGVVLYTNQTDKLLMFYLSSMENNYEDIRSSALRHLQTALKNDDDLNWNKIEESLWNLLKKEENFSILKLIMELLSDIGLKEKCGSNHLNCNETTSKCSRQKLKEKIDQFPGLRHHVLSVEALIFRDQVKSVETLQSGELNEWCQLVERASCPDGYEDVRLMATKCLLLVGQEVFKIAANTKKESCIVSLLEATLRLIDEEDNDIRKMAVKFISQLCIQNTKGHYMNSNYCIKIFLEYICDNFWWSDSIFTYLMDKLYIKGSLDKSVKSTLNGQCNQVLFEHDEDSFFSERVLRCLDYHQTLKNLLRKRLENQSKTVSGFSSKDLDEIHAEITDNLNIMYGRLKDRCILNVTSVTSVMTSLSGLILYSEVLCQVVETSTPQTLEKTQHLKSSIKSVFELNYLHPWYAVIKGRLKDIIS